MSRYLSEECLSEPLSPSKKLYAKYLVLKRSDLDECLTEDESAQLGLILGAVEKHRREEGKNPKKRFICISENDQNFNRIQYATLFSERLKIS